MAITPVSGYPVSGYPVSGYPASGIGRMVTVWCPDWPIIAAGVPADTAAVVLRANRVVARSMAAAAEGVAVGQRRRDAQRLCPNLTVVAHDPDRDARAFDPVLRAVGRFTPRLDVVEPGWIRVEARGPSRFFGGDRQLADHITTAIAETSPTPAQIGIADGRFPSGVAARLAGRHPIVIEPGGSPTFLAPLPVAWLVHLGETEPDLIGLFTRLGVRCLGQLAALPEVDVSARFGAAGCHAHQLATSTATATRPTRWEEPPQRRDVEQSFDDPITQLATVAFAAKQLADQLTTDLAATGQICTRLIITAESAHGERNERTWYRATGLTAPAMIERVRWQLASWTSAGDLTAGVIMLRLDPDEIRGNDGEQYGLWGGRSAADERAMRTIARLTGLVGDHNVFVAAWHGGRLPGDRYRWISAATTDLTDTTQRLRPDSDPTPWPGALPPPSPANINTSPVPVLLADHNGQMIRVSGRGELTGTPATFTMDGRPPLNVTEWAGPWPLDESWWEPNNHRRAARLQILTSDGAAHLILAEHHTWWIAATYT